MSKIGGLLFVLVGTAACGGDDSSDAEAMNTETPGPGAAMGEAPSSPGNGATTTAPSNRIRMSCSELETEIETTSASVGFPVEVTLGAWDGVPEELKALPAGAEMCGTVDLLNQGFFVSPLWADDLEAHYRPIFEGLGCAPFECELETMGDAQQFLCSCYTPEYNYGALTVTSDIEYYLLTYQ